MMLDEERIRAEAETLYRDGHTCSQAVLLPFCDFLGIQQDLAMRCSASFGRGMGGMGEVCGAFSGMLMALGLYCAPSEAMDAQEKKAHNENVRELARRFRERSGAIVCCQILPLAKKPCHAICGDAAAIMAEWLNEQESF